MYFFKQYIFLFIVTRNCFLEALRYPLSMKCYSTFCKTLNPSCIYSVRNCRVDFSVLDFEMCIPRLLFLFRKRDGQRSRQPPLYSYCLQLHPPAQLHPSVEIRIDQISPPSWNASAGVCIDPYQQQLRCSREFDFSSSAVPSTDTVHVIHPCCELAVVRIRVFVSRPRSLPSCSRTKL